MLRGFYERTVVYSPNGSRTANSVKRFFGGPIGITKREGNVPLYAPGQNSRNEKYIQTSITD
jgi:hypothetical protein